MHESKDRLEKIVTLNRHCFGNRMDSQMTA
jgi:hypothetical protein